MIEKYIHLKLCDNNKKIKYWYKTVLVKIKINYKVIYYIIKHIYNFCLTVCAILLKQYFVATIFCTLFACDSVVFAVKRVYSILKTYWRKCKSI